MTQPFYTNSIVHAVYTIASSWDTFVNSQVNIDELEEFNTNPNQTPWIGIYSPGFLAEPFRMNNLFPFKATYTIPVIVQVANLKTPKEAIYELEDLTVQLITAVNCYRSLLGTVQNIVGFESQPYDRVIESEDNLLANQVVFFAEVF